MKFYFLLIHFKNSGFTISPKRFHNYEEAKTIAMQHFSNVNNIGSGVKHYMIYSIGPDGVRQEAFGLPPSDGLKWMTPGESQS